MEDLDARIVLGGLSDLSKKVLNGRPLTAPEQFLIIDLLEKDRRGY